MWFRKLKLKLPAGAYLTVIQLSTGLKSFWAFFFWNGQIEKKVTILFCVFSYSKCLPRASLMACSPSRQSPTELLHYSFIKVYTDVTRLCTGRQGTLSLAPVLAVVTFFVSMSTMWVERLFGLALLHAYRHMSIDTDKMVQDFCARKPHSLAFDFWTPVRKPSFGLIF